MHINSSKTQCYQSFPPLFSIQDLVAKALSDSTASDTDAVISAWDSALASTPSDPAFFALADSESGRARSVSFFRGAAAATIFSLLISFGNLIFSSVIWLRAEEETKMKFRWIIFGISILDSLIFIAGCICFAFAMKLGPNALTEDPVDPSGGLPTGVGSFDIGYLVFLTGVVFKLICVPPIGFIVICVLGIEVIFFVLMFYLMWKGILKMMSHPYPGTA
jgi:hypothetical protein